MPKLKAFSNIEIIAGGVTEAIAADSLVEKIQLYTNAPVVLAGNVSITDDGSWVEGQEIEILYNGSVTLGAFNITVFGYTLTQDQATAGNLLIKPYCIGGAFVTTAIAGAGTAQIGTADLAPLSVTTAKIDNLAVTSGKLAANSVIAGKINAGTIVNADVNAAAAIAKSKLGALAIVNADVDAAAAIAVSKLEAMGDGQIITGNTGAGNVAQIKTMSSDTTIANTGAVTIAANAVTPSKSTIALTDEVIEVFVNCDDGGVFNYSTVIPYNFTVISDSAILETAAVGNITIALDINGVAVTGGTISFALLDAANTQNAGTAVTANNTGTTGQNLNLSVSSSDAGETAHALVSIRIRRTN